MADRYTLPLLARFLGLTLTFDGTLMAPCIADSDDADSEDGDKVVARQTLHRRRSSEELAVLVDALRPVT